jgi:hypothetical protein
MYKAAESFSQSGARPRNLPSNIDLPGPLSAELVAIAKGFKQLQDERHAADYDVSQSFDRMKLLALVQTAEDIVSNWRKEKFSGNAPVFLSSLNVLAALDQIASTAPKGSFIFLRQK